MRTKLTGDKTNLTQRYITNKSNKMSTLLIPFSFFIISLYWGAPKVSPFLLNTLPCFHCSCQISTFDYTIELLHHFWVYWEVPRISLSLHFMHIDVFIVPAKFQPWLYHWASLSFQGVLGSTQNFALFTHSRISPSSLIPLWCFHCSCQDYHIFLDLMGQQLEVVEVH